MLRDIHLSSDFIDLRAPWLHHLHSMTLDNTYSFSDVLAILTITRNLQELKIVDIPTGVMDTSHPVILLSHLQALEFHSDKSNMGITLLEYLAIPVDCSLSIHINSFSDDSTLENEKPFILSTIDKFTDHAKRHFETCTINNIELGYKKKDHIFLICTASLPAVRSVRIWVTLSSESEESLLETFLTKLLQLDMTGTTNLKFTAQGRLISRFGSVFSQLASVDTISTEIETLSKLVDFNKSSSRIGPEKPEILFPMLKVVTLLVHSHPGAPHNISFINQVVGGFILSRLRAGVPITMLDMSKYPPLRTAPNLQALGNAKGLTVRYRRWRAEGIIEYTY